MFTRLNRSMINSISIIVNGVFFSGSIVWFTFGGRFLIIISIYYFKNNNNVVSWLGKTGYKLFTGGEDGVIKWWDIRNISRPEREFLVGESVTSLAFESTMPSRVK